MKYKTYERFCVKIVIECAECAGTGSRFHHPIHIYDADLCIWVVLHIIVQEAVILIKYFQPLMCGTCKREREITA